MMLNIMTMFEENLPNQNPSRPAPKPQNATCTIRNGTQLRRTCTKTTSLQQTSFESTFK